MKAKMIGSGWHKESLRHSNAKRLGRAGGTYASDKLVKHLVGKEPYKNLSYQQLEKRGLKLNPEKDSDKDGVKNKDDCKPLNKREQGKIHKLDKLLDKAEDKAKTPEQKQKILQARKELQQVTTKEKLKAWYERHKNAVQIAGAFLGAGAFLVLGTGFLTSMGMTLAEAGTGSLVTFLTGGISFGVYKTIKAMDENERYDLYKKLQRKTNLTSIEQEQYKYLKKEFN